MNRIDIVKFIKWLILKKMKLDRIDMVKFINFFIDILRNIRCIRSNNV